MSRSRVCLAFVLLLPLLAARPVRAAEPVGVRSFKSGPIQITADGRWVWVAATHADAVARIDTASGAVTRFNLPQPDTTDRPMGLAVTEDGSEVWVACHDSDRIYVLNGASGDLKARIDLPWGSGPYSVALSRPDGTGRQRWALVTLFRSGRLAAVDRESHDVLDLGPVHASPFGIAFTEDGQSAWVTHLFVNDEHPFFARVDLTGERPRVTTISNAFAATPRATGQLHDEVGARNVAEGGYLNFRGHPAQLPASTGKEQLWLPTQYHNMGQDVFGPSSTLQASLRKLDLPTRRVSSDDKVVLTAVDVHDPTKGDNNPPWLGYGWNAGVSGLVDIGFATLAGKLHAVLVAEQSDEVVVLPWDTPPLRSTTDANAPGLPELRVGDRPMGIALAPNAATGYVYNDLSADVSVLSLADPAHPKELRRLALPEPVAPDPIADATARRGAKLFFTSADKRISADEKVACASCHLNGEEDGRIWPFDKLPAGTAGQRRGPRMTMDLLGLGRTFTAGQRDPVLGLGLLHTSGDRDEIQDFEFTFRGPMMGGTGFLGDRAHPELGDANAGLDADLDAVASYLVAVPPLARSPARDAGGRLTEAAVRGATYFMGQGDNAADAACGTCHVPEKAFQDGGFHDVGARRPSTEHELNEGDQRRECLWCASTPSLLGNWSHPNLRGTWQYPGPGVDLLLDFRADSGRPKPHGRLTSLDNRQLEDLAAFLRSIDGQLDAATVRSLKDSTPPRIRRVAVVSPTRLEVWFSEAVDDDTAEIPANYVVEDVATGSEIPVRSATPNRTWRDRVTLTLARALAVQTRDGGYRLYPAPANGERRPIRDRADAASGGVANAINPADAANRHSFGLGETLTVTLGASNEAMIPVVVHDASTLGPNLSTWGNDRAWLYDTNGNGPNSGFVRFDWRAPFLAATGLGASTDLLAATLSMVAEEGDAQTVEIRRVLQPWRDPPGRNDYNQNPVGGPTWRDHSHPDQPWNRPGAQALGGSGADPADYLGRYDVAEVVDASAAPAAVNAGLTFAGDRVTLAYRFWFDHPELDFGHALRLKGDAGVIKTMILAGADQNLAAEGPLLTLTYRVSGANLVTPPGPTATPRDVTRTPEPTRPSEATRTSTPRPDASRTPTPTSRPPEPTRDPRLAWQVFFPWVGNNGSARPTSPEPGNWSGSGTGGLQYLQFFVSSTGREVCGTNGRVPGCLTFFLDPCVPIDSDGNFTVLGPSGRELHGHFTSPQTATGTWTLPECGVSGSWSAGG